MNGEDALQAKHRLILQFTVGLMAFVSTLNAAPMTSPVTSTVPVIMQVKGEVQAIAAIPQVATSSDKLSIETPKLVTVESKVRAYFSDIPVMAEVARCESGFNQLNKDGSMFRGIVNSKDVGVMQINERYHLKRSQTLDMDIYSLEGNMAYARLLYMEQGTQPWSASAPCWAKTTVAKAAAKASVQIALK